VTRLFILSALSIAIALFPGCKAKNYDLVIMSPHQEKIQNEFTAAFQDWFKAKHGRVPAISLQDQGSGTGTQEQFISQRFVDHPEGIGIDLFFGGGSEPHMNLAAKGLLVSYLIPNRDQVAPDILGIPLYDPEYRYYGAALSGFGIVYNRAILKDLGLQEPTSWEILARPELFGKVGAVDPMSGSALAAYETILQAYGWDKGMRILALLAANSQTFYSVAGGVPDNVGRRQIAIGCAIDFYAANQIELSGADEVGFCMPEKLTVITPDPISILKGAPHLETAQEFVAFVMSEEGQRLWFLPVGAAGGPKQKALNRMPVIPALYERYASQALVKYDPFKFTKSFKYDSELAITRRDIFRSLFQATLKQPHSQLRDAWKEVIKVKDNEALIAELVKPPVTEAELLTLAQHQWSDEAVRSRLMTQWTNWAYKKYDAVRTKALSARH